MFRFLSLTGLLLLPYSFLVLPVHAQTLPPCGQGQANALADGDIDHYDLVCFTSIPDAYITTASNQTLLRIDRSVGANIDFALNCLAEGTVYVNARSACKRDLAPTDYISDIKYNRANWQFAHYGDGGWYGNVENYILNQGLRRIDGSALVPWTPNYNSFNIHNFQFSYLSVASNNTDIISSSGFFVDPPSSPNAYRDINDMVAFEANYPDTTFVYATTSLARTLSSTVSETFNTSMRQYATDNQIPLIDFADIGSHNPTGNPCLYNGFEALCADYTTETNGGHLVQGIALQRVARTMWLMMASLAGWNPNGSNPTTPPPPPSTTPIPLPGDNDHDQDRDVVDLWLLLSRFNTVYTPYNLLGTGLIDIFDFNFLVQYL